MKRLFSPIVFCALFFLLLVTPISAEITPDQLAGLQVRSIGPAAMSGRIAAIDAVIDDPKVIWIGVSSGGVWRSNNAGLNWKPLFDGQPVHSIGALAIDQQRPDVVWVGTGEGNPRNSVSVGNGVYRTLDGGKTWSHLGLEKTERIHRILLDARDADVAYAAALGQMWGANEERGVYKTVDGGKTWTKVLYVDENTGAADLVMDPRNPRKLIAAMWDYRREPWFFRSGGPGSGLHLTYDGGETWKKLGPEHGLPSGELGRIGVAISPSHPNIVYALVEAETSALLRSEDGGESWKTVNAGPKVSGRPFYYADLRVDPAWPNRVYRLASLMDMSDDGGRSFKPHATWPPVHPDHHAMWIHPENPEHILLGNDGGLVISHDRGESWRFVRNLPLGQFYHVAVDQATPYNIYGGLQDNGSWRGPNTVWQDGGIRNHHWQLVSFGDGFDTRPDRELANVGYSMAQEGYLVRWNLDTSEQVSIRPSGPDGEDLRFNWNAGLALDPFDASTIYYGSQYVHRSRDRGETWEIISPDLSTDRPEWQKQAESGGLTPDVTGAENFTSILAIVPSPIESGLLWVGTDDGRLHITRDGGESWQSVEKNVPGVPESTWIPHIEASSHDASTAFVVFDDHRRSNWTPYVFKTTDFGKTWKSLVAGPEERSKEPSKEPSEAQRPRGYALSLVQDSIEPNLLFLGTEFGLYVSLDGGDRWLPFKHGLPTASVMDLAIHPRDHDLIIATHGRSVFVLDDLGPLRELAASPEVLAKPLHLFPVADAQQYRKRMSEGELAPGHGEFSGQDRAYGAILTFSLDIDDLSEASAEESKTTVGLKEVRGRCEPVSATKETSGEQVEIEIYQGETKIRSFQAPARNGLQRVVWNLKRDPFRELQQEPAWWYGEPSGPEVPSGEYEVVMRFRDQEARAAFRVLQDPRTDYRPEDVAAKWRLLLEVGEMQSQVTRMVERLEQHQCSVDLVLRRVEDLRKDLGADEDPYEELSARAESLREALQRADAGLRNANDAKGIPPENTALSKIFYAKSRLVMSWAAPNTTDLDYVRQARAQLGEAMASAERVLAEDVPPFAEQTQELELGLFPRP